MSPWSGTIYALSLLMSIIASVGSAISATISVDEQFISVRGRLNEKDISEFRNKAGPLREAIVEFESDGGSVIAGIKIGEFIRAKAFRTRVLDRCASACALAWLGGVQRIMGRQAQVGFHAAYNVLTGEETGVGNALVGAYLSQLGMPYSTVIYITQAPPSSMTWLDVNEAKEKGIEVTLLEGPEYNQRDTDILQMRLVEAAIRERNYTMAAHLLRPLASRGYAKAQSLLGKLLYFGEGVAKDETEGLLWSRKAADQGDAEAQYIVAESILINQFNKPDKDALREAVNWYRLAADQGHTKAMYSLALKYFYGLGVQEDAVEGIRWCKLAADQGDADAAESLGDLYSQFNGPNSKPRVTLNYKEALKWYRRAAGRIDATGGAQYKLARMYDKGLGTAQDFARAAFWYGKAAHQGYRFAQDALGRMYVAGHGVPTNYILAHMWLNLAALRNLESAAKARDLLARSMSPKEIMEAQRLAREWSAVKTK